MKLKKNPSKDLTKNRGLYFVAGLAFVLGMTLFALEWKTFAIWPEEYGDVYENNLVEVDSAIVITTFSTPQAVTEIEIVECDIDIETIEPFSEPIISVDAVTYIDAEKEFICVGAIEQVPIFPGCEDAKDQKTCFSEMILKHVQNNLRYPESAVDLCLGGRVSVLFEIGEDGNVANIKTRGPHKILETEAARIISKLPKMKPGKERGQAVKVSYSIPLNFKLQ